MPRTPKSTMTKKKQPTSAFQKFFLLTVKLLVSPVVLFMDSFRPKKTIDKSWIYAFFLFTTLVIGFTGLAILVNDGPLFKTLRMISTLTENREVLSGDVQPIIKAVNRYSLQNNVDPTLVYAIIKTESNFQQYAVSASGARGLMQIMPDVWRHYSKSACNGKHPEREICHPGNCIFAPEANIKVGVIYLRELLNRYQGRVDLALEAYNAGISNVRPGMEPKYHETKSYIQKTVFFWQELRKSALDQQLQASIKLQSGLKWLFATSFSCWLVLFWWASRKLFIK